MTYPQHNSYPVAKKVESLYQGRIRQFTARGGQYGNLNLAHYFDRTRIDFPSFIKLEVYSVPDLARPSFKEAMKQAEGQWKPAHKGDWFGPSWSTHWFRISVRIPSDWPEKYSELPIFDFDSSDEGFWYTTDGEPLRGLSGEHHRSETELPSEWSDGNWHQFYIETSCNNITGTGSPPDPNRRFRLNRADLLVPNAPARALNIDFWILGDASREFPQNSWQKHKALDTLNQVVNAFDRDNVDGSVPKCREIAATYLGENPDSAEVYKTKSINEPELVWAIGNCHIDTAWLWPWAETRRKIARSWSTQLELLEKYPEYVFAASQAVQFQWLKEDHPDLFKRVQKAVKDGRFVPIGGAWVESDTNLPSGEALVRQQLLGQRFFEREFGIRSKVFWLPDTFGYAPQLPQVCRLAGQPYFLTQKLSWNNIDVFPLSTFSWVGLDGSQVVCHMPPTNTYTAQAHFGDVKRAIEQHKNLDTSQSALLLYGYGDGGGGPTAEMIEKLRRCRAIANEVSLLPTVTSSERHTPEKFFDKVVADTNNGKDLVSWRGELYLEYHRGTYTTQAAIKRGNRRSEILLRDLELFATSASLKTNYVYPYKEVERLWRLVCLNQFHDVLPGSGIEMIYEDARRVYEEVWNDGSKLVKEALQALGYETADETDTKARFLPDIDGIDDYGQDARLTAEYEKLVPTNFECSGAAQTAQFELENEAFVVKFDSGSIVSVWDKHADREVLKEGGVGNQFLLFEDQPLNFPAWDTEQYATEKFDVLSPQKWQQRDDVSAELVWEFSKSKIHQRIVLHPSYIEFATNVDWHETYQFLKVEFPVDVVNDFASYETSFGVQRRPTHFNTTWDAAKFEVNAHRFADLSDWHYGVALLNDCKYGYSIHGDKMRLSLLRAPKSPDAHADMGLHSFRYALMPHTGPLSPRVVKTAQYFNHPHYWVKNPNWKRPEMLGAKLIPHVVMAYGDESILISAVKRPDADEGTKNRRAVVRVYETLGGKARGYLSSFLPVKSVLEVNILEDEHDGKAVDVLMAGSHEEEQDRIPLRLNAFEVKTLLVEFA